MKVYKPVVLSVLFLLMTSAYTQMLQASLHLSHHFDEPSDVRAELSEYLLSSAFIGLNAPRRIIYSDLIHKNIEFRVARQGDFFYHVLVPEHNGIFPLYSKGTYIIKRNSLNGEYVQIKIFLKTEASCFARIFPQDERSVLQLYLYGRKIGDDVILPVAFEDLLFLPFDEVVNLTEHKIPWDIVWPENSPLHDSVRIMADRIAPHLSALGDEDDGAMNKDGVFVYIETGERQRAGGFNCSGFAKWVADGLYRQSHNELLDIEVLKQKHTDKRGNSFSIKYEDDRDPYFGLDWTRNIATAFTGGGYESADVRHVKFFKYTEDVGYRVKDLKGLLYQLAVDSPGSFYMGSVNLEFGQNPTLWQHVHVVVIFPYLTSDGELSVRVMERNIETGLDSLMKRYPDGFIHLVRLEARENFRPFDIVTSLE